MGLLWVSYTKPPWSFPSAMPDHIRVWWTMVCEQSTIAYTPLAPYRITVCPSWTEERSQSPVDMEHMPLLHQRAYTGVTAAHTLALVFVWRPAGAAPGAARTWGESSEKNGSVAHSVCSADGGTHCAVSPRIAWGTLPPAAAPPPSMAWAAATLLPQPAAIRQMLKVSLLPSCCCTGLPAVILWEKDYCFAHIQEAPSQWFTLGAVQLQWTLWLRPVYVYYVPQHTPHTHSVFAGKVMIYLFHYGT